MGQGDPGGGRGDDEGEGVVTLLVAGTPAWRKAVEIAKSRTEWVRPNPDERYPGEIEEVSGASGGSDGPTVPGEAQAEA